ncbi:class C sortase, partial [Streptococcus agalactiae]|nr:class C sortase [Streptococcus agalactiae]
LPLYHGTSEKVLQTSIGHLEGSSLPIGGDSTHSILSGHRGLPSSRLFSDLDKLKVGDHWTVSILNETYTYQVDQIRTVKPDDLRDLQIVKGKDYQTLVTCTPYGVNTHRLLVRGHRVPNDNGNALVVAEAIQIEPIYIAPFIAIFLTLILLLISLEVTRRARQRKKILKQAMRKEENNDL